MNPDSFDPPYMQFIRIISTRILCWGGRISRWFGCWIRMVVLNRIRSNRFLHHQSLHEWSIPWIYSSHQAGWNKASPNKHSKKRETTYIRENIIHNIRIEIRVLKSSKSEHWRHTRILCLICWATRSFNVPIWM